MPTLCGLRRTALVVTLAATIASCRDQSPASSVSDSTFVRTMVELRRVQSDSTIDSMMEDSVRRVVLRRNGVSVEALDAAARALAADPARASAVFHEIETRTRRTTARPPTRSPAKTSPPRP